jgi:hypothetical protein
MLENKIVFIVGAGASVDYGFPLGGQLKEDIVTGVNFDFDFPYGEATKGDRTIAQAARDYSQGSGEALEELIKAGEKIARGMPGARSIDNFLHSREGDDDINLMGKLGIAKAILAAERGSELCVSTRQETERARQSQFLTLSEVREDFHSLPNSWLGKFATLLCQGFHHERLTGLFDNVAFIIFNYDRCVEHYLWNHLQQYFGISETEAAALLGTVEFHHPYGTVGRLPWQDGAGYAMRFGKEPSSRDLLEVAKGINTFTESVHTEARAKLLDDLRTASQVMFLGFGFIEQNMRLLDFDDRGLVQRIFATAIGMSPDSCEAVDIRIREAFKLPLIVGGGKVDNVRVHADLTAASIFDYYSQRLGR